MLANEWKKIVKDRFLSVVLAAFLAAGVLFTFVKARADTKIDVRAYVEVFTLYETDPEAFAANKAEIANRLTDWYSEEAKQLAVYDLAEQQASYPEQYKKKLSVIIGNAARTLREYDAMRMKEHSYLYVRQENYRDIYTALSEVEIDYEFVRGWDLWFSYDFLMILLVVFLVISLPRIFSYEREYGVLSVTRSTPNGRGKLARAKLVTALLFTSAATTLFTFVPLLPIACVTGFSSLSNSAHVLSQFVYMPFDWSVGQLLLAAFALRLSAMLCFASVLYAVYALFRSYYGTVLCGIGVVAADLAFGEAGGLFYLALPSRAFEIYDCFNFFSKCAPTLYFTFGMVLLVSIALFLVGIPLFFRRGEKRIYNKRAFAVSFLGEPRTLFGQELKKLFVKRGGLAVLLLALLVRCGISMWQYRTDFTAAEHFYMIYMEELQGELTEEKERFVEQETARQKQLRNMTEEVIQSHPESEWEDLRQAVMASGDRLHALERIEMQMRYVSETGGAYLLADTGWQALFARDFDFVFYAAFLLMAAGIVARERDLRAEPVLRAAYRGRHALYRSKTAALLVFFVMLYIGCTACDGLCFLANHALPNADYPAQSISVLAFAKGIKVGTFCILAALGSFLTALFFVLVCVGTSARLGSTYAVLAVLLSVLFVPFLALKLGLEEIGYVSVAELASFGQYPVLLGGTALWGLSLLLWACLSVSVYLVGRKALCKTR